LAGSTGLCTICLNNGGQSGNEIKSTGNWMKYKPDPEIGESNMQLYLREPNIKWIAVWTSSHCGSGSK
jgi:hypothetical protein